ncbi:MAG: peptidylprolyl isomerase [bacterium]
MASKKHRIKISLTANVCGSAYPFFFFVLIFVTSVAAKNQDDTLAVIGNRIITSNQFITNYKEKLTKLGLTDNGEIRQKFLMDLIRDEILITEARSLGMDTASNAVVEKQRIKTQQLLNSYSEKHLASEIKISEDDLKLLFIRVNTKLNVRHLFAETLEDANFLYNDLMSGKSFEELAKKIFNDAALKNSGGLLGYISFDEMDPEFEKAAFALQPGEISKPVKTVYGYSIIKVEDVFQNPFVTESEYLKAHDRLLALAKKRAFEDAVKKFTSDTRSKLSINFNEVFISRIFDQVRNGQLGNLIEKNKLFSSDEMKETTVYSKNGNWTLEKLFTAIQSTQDKQRNFIRTRENLEDFIAGLVIREYIVDEAENEKLNSEPGFNEKVEYDFDTYLLTALESELKKEIKIPSDTIKSYYQKHFNEFLTPAEIRLSSILVADKSVADSVCQWLKEGKKFEGIAMNYSTQRLTAVKGGDIGFFKKEELADLGEPVFSLSPGEWMGPVEDNGNFLFLKCTGYKNPVSKTHDEVYTEIENSLAALEWFKYRNQITDSLQAKFHVQLFIQTLKSLKL